MSFRPIFGKPRLTQDWGDEEQGERETHWTSLFYDLLVVAALNTIAEPFEETEQEDGEAAPHLGPIHDIWLDALLKFVCVIMAWNSLNEYTAVFEDESLIGHMAFFVHCFGLASTTAGCVGELEDNWQTLATGIILSNFGLLVMYVRPFWYIPRVRPHSIARCAPFVVITSLMFWCLTFSDGDDAFERFRMVLIGCCIISWLSVMGVAFLGSHRIPLHVQSYADRQKEVTMVIFGEAIFAVTLKPRETASEHSHFYVALGTTLWLIYSLALQEYHIMPSVDDHALRRSVFFGFSWYYTQFAKQVFLMGVSIGIKRLHLLTFVAPDEPIDKASRDLVVWGMSLTLFGVTLIRAWHFGFGRHPSKYDPPSLYRLKIGWWATIGLSCLMPQLIGSTAMRAFPDPLACLMSLSLMMLFIVVFEAWASNMTALMTIKIMGSQGDSVDELTYLSSTSADSIRKPGAFLHEHCPKAELQENGDLSPTDQFELD